MKYFCLLIFALLLLSCSEEPAITNPYDTNFDLPEPENLQVEHISLTTNIISWDYEMDNIEGFKIVRKHNDEWCDYLIANSDANSYTDENIPGNMYIQYKIIAFAGDNQSDEVISSQIINNMIPLPNNFNVQKVNTHCYNLTWQQDHITGEDGFVIERKIEDGEFEQVVEVGENVEYYQDEWEGDYRDNNIVEYRIKVYVGNEYSDYLNSNNEILASPTVLTYEKLAINQIRLSWQDNSIGEDGFRISKKVGEDDWIEGYNVTEEDIVNWIDVNAEINENLNYRIIAFYENIHSYSIETGIIDNTFPAPTNIQYDRLSINNIEISWNDNSIGEEGVRIDKKVGNNDWIENYDDTNSDITNWIDENAEINENLKYSITAFHNDIYSNTIETSIIDNTFPAPTNIQYDRLSINNIEISWEDNSIGEEGFRIDKKLGENNWIEGYEVTEEDVVNWIDVNAEINENITYRIYAYYGIIISDLIETEVIDNSFPTPNNLCWYLESDNVILTWEYELVGIDGFRIEKKADGEDWLLYSDNIDADLREWTDYNVNEFDSYRIKAYYQSFESPVSNETTIYYSFVLEENFENWPSPGWLLIDQDGDSENWFLYTNNPHTGSNCIASASWTSQSGALNPDNWLIAPSITVYPNTTLKWWAAAQDQEYPTEHYSVLLSLNSNDPDDFTIELFNETLNSIIWHEVEVSLSEFAGENVYIAWRHHNSNDMYRMKIDDILITNIEQCNK